MDRVRAGHEAQIGFVSPLEQTHLKLAQVLAAKLRVDVAALGAEVQKLVSAQSIASCNSHVSCRNCGQTNALSNECMVHLDTFENQV